jgi:O-antigen/teichoic acid export membrane protein
MPTKLPGPISSSTRIGTALRSVLEHRRNRRVVLSAGIGMFQRVMQLGGTLLVMPLLLRVLGPAKFGIWGAIASLAWLSGVVDIGTGTALVTLVARSSALERTDQARRHIAGALGIGSGLAAVTLLVVFLVSSIWGVSGTLGPYLIAVVGLAFNLPLSAGNNLWMALQKGYVSSFWELLQTVLYTGGLIGVSFFTSDVRAYVAVVYLCLVVTNAGSLVHLFLRHPEMRPRAASFSRGAIREVAGQGFLYFALALTGGLSYMLDNVLTLSLLGPEASARMTIAMRMCFTAVSALSVISMPLWPAFSEAAEHGDRRWIHKTLIGGTAFLVGLTVAGSAVLLTFGERFLRLWLHTDLGIGQGLLWAISAWVLAQAFIRVPNLLLNGLAIVRYQIVMAATTTSLMLAMKFILAPYFGVAGILWSTTATVLLIGVPAWFWRIWRWAEHPTPLATSAIENRVEEIVGNSLP